jgi:hypothetical protein
MGNVTSFELNLDDVTKMLKGELMPRPPAILSSLVQITFISRHKLPKNWLKGTFHVRREAVRRGLVWLKHHNPKYYSNVNIDEDALASLPEDDVPMELISIIRHESDKSHLDAEDDNYVPRNECDNLDVDIMQQTG